jgi:TonB-linked SusC/RagA family outer membrane protein
MNIKLLALLSLLFAGGMSGLAQSVKGKVLSGDDNNPLPGVSILEKGTTNGTVTDGEGNFAIVVKPESTLVFSFVGYATQEIQVAAQTTLNIQMQPDVQALNEVVVIGYGSGEKKDLTGSLVAVKAGDLNRGILASPQDMLVGRIAGVQVSTNDGAPGSGSTIRIRGSGSISANQEPLIVVDGFPLAASTIPASSNGQATSAIPGQSNGLASINPNDIETFTVLKDAAATAIYGLRASNGVIIITTKKGKSGKPQVGYNGTFSLSSPMKYVDVLSGDEMRALANTMLERGEVPGLTPQAAERLGDANTDWQKEIYRTAFTHDHNVNLSGTVKNLPYRISIGHTDQDGILNTSEFKRNSVNINLSPEFLDGDLKVTASFKGSHINQNFGNTDAIGSAVSFDPTQPVYNGSTRWGGFFTWVDPSSATTLDPNGDPTTLATANPVALLMQRDNRATVYRGIGTLQVDYRLKFFPAVKLTANGGFDYSSSTGHNNSPTDAAFTYANGLGQINDYTGKNKSRLLDLYLNYNKTIGKHDIDFTAGYSYQRFDIDGSSFIRNGFETTFQDYQTNAEGKPVPRQYISNPNVLLSFFGRLNYNFNEKYLLTLSFRDDASSRFSEQNRWVIFPAAGLAWRVKQESFLEGVTALTDLKVRASYGLTGQQDVTNNPYPYLSTYQASSSTSQYQFGNAFVNTYRPQPYDADLKWETTAQTNLGVDFDILAGKLSGTVDVYQRKTRNLINAIPIPGGSNFSNVLVTNVGNLENRGIEITLNTLALKTKNLQWNAGVNFTHNQNEITKLLKVDDPNYQGVNVGGIGKQRTIQNIQVGYPINSFFVLQQVYDNQGKPVEDIYVDRSGKGGPVAGSDENKYRLHSPQADYLIGINSRVTYKQFDFSFSGRLSIGNYLYNGVQAGNSYYNNMYASIGFFSNMPAGVNDTGFYNQQSFSDYFIENASFFKMDNISLGYNVTPATEKLRARVSLTVQNAFFITKYKGLDPEVNTGIDNNIYPRARVFMLGVNLTY